MSGRYPGISIDLDDDDTSSLAGKEKRRSEGDALAAAAGFPSRRAVTAAQVATADSLALPTSTPRKAPVQRRQRQRITTGRNKQINIKTTQETIDRFYRIADEIDVPLGELLERALNAFEKNTK